MIVGIDLGTTNSLVSAWTNEGITMIPNELGEYLTPSVVSFDADGTTYVGAVAKERLVTHAMSTFQEFKRDMGSKTEYKAFDKTYTATDLSALVLRQLKKDAEKFLGEPVNEVIISVPAYFTDEQRAATRNAGLIAGLHVNRLVNEPSAAALYYHSRHMEDAEQYLVFDFGGGTLDVTLVDAFENIIEIQGISGDNHLGGADFNHVIALEICKQNNMDLQSLTDMQRAQVYRHAEEVKMKLSGANEVSEDFFIHQEGGQLRMHVSMDTQRLIDISSEIFSRLTIVLKRLLNQAGSVSKDDIAGVIMVGGSSKMPAVRTYLYTLFGDKLLYDENPDEIVCRGAGCAAGIQQRSDGAKDLILTDICPFTLGVKIQGDIMSPIIHRNEVLPCSRTETYSTVRDRQTELRFAIYQGEFHQASKNKLLHTINLKIPPKPAGEVFVHVTFAYDINGIFAIELNSPYIENAVREEIMNTIGLSEEEIARRKARLEALRYEQGHYNLRMEMVINHAERLYAECNREQQEYLARYLDTLRHYLALGDTASAKGVADKLNALIEFIEKNMFRFDDRDANLWEQYLEHDNGEV
jgi:molecular chaperone HscC